MTYSFDAAHMFIEDDGYMEMVGLADDEFEPKKYVIIQRVHECDEQDKELGMDKIHIQVEDESRSKYGGISAISVDGGVVGISLHVDARKHLLLDGNIEVTISEKHPNFVEFKSTLKKMCEAERIRFEDFK